MNDAQLLRYSRHILLPQIGIDGQQKLLDARVLIIGVGGLGSPVSMYLAASGVGHLVLVDFDKVDLTNLQRQIVHVTETVGQTKVASATARLNALNPDVQITGIERQLDAEELLEQVRLADAVIDGSDNFPTRFAVNAACVRAKKPLISAAVTRFEGQVAVFRNDQPNRSCYRCLYDDTGEVGETCVQFGVLAPVAGLVGCVQATETMKVLMGIGEPLADRMLMLDALTMEWRTVKLRKDPRCPVCRD
ncbi:MAG: molybdopterin-synthase adenylyltransferase MoeB [Gammaproteobacteria bacterium]|nr:molybdopterin-synthase adenylyltransferase MoeB [Gammaproteobacteria bacterium]